MDENHINGVTDHQAIQEPTKHTDDTVLNGNDDVFKCETDSTPPLKTNIVVKSTRDSSCSADEKSGNDVDQGTEKKYKCIIKARTSVEEYSHGTDSNDEIESESNTLKVVVRTHSTEDTNPVEDERQTTVKNSEATSDAIALQAKEIIQELIEKLDNEAVAKNEPSEATEENVKNIQHVVSYEIEQHKEQVKPERTVEIQEKGEQTEKHNAITTNEKQENEEDKKRKQDTNDDILAAVESSPKIEDKAQGVALTFEKHEESRDEEMIVTEEQVPEVAQNKKQAIADNKNEEVLSIPLTPSAALQEDKILEPKSEEIPFVEVDEDMDERSPQELVTKEMPEKNKEETEEEVEGGTFASPEMTEFSSAAVKVEKEETKPDKEKRETVKSESNEEERDEENLVTVEVSADAEVNVLPIVKQEDKQIEEEKAETIAMKFESEEEEHDEENVVMSGEPTSVEVLKLEENAEEEKPEGEIKAETVAMKFETKDEQTDDESLVLAEERVSVEELPDVQNEQNGEENKAETLAMKFVTEEEQTDKENFVMEDTTTVQVDEKHEETDQKEDYSEQTDEKAKLITMKFESNIEQSINEHAANVEDVPHKQPEAEETRTESEVERLTEELNAKAFVPVCETKQENEHCHAKGEDFAQMEAEEKPQEPIVSTTNAADEYSEMQTQEVSSTVLEGEEEPSSPKQEYVAELFNTNSQSLQEIEEGSEGTTDDQLEEKPIVKVRLAEEPFNAISDESQYDADVVEVTESKFEDHVLNNEDETSVEFFEIREENQNSDSDGEVDIKIEKHSQENEVLIKEGGSDYEGTDDWMAKDDIDEVVFKGTQAATAVNVDEKEEVEELDIAQEKTGHKELQRKETEQKSEVIEDVVFNENQEEVQENQEMHHDATTNVADEKNQPHETMDLDNEMNIADSTEPNLFPYLTDVNVFESTKKNYEYRREETEQETPRDDIIFAKTQAITVCSDIGELFKSSEEELQYEEAPQEKELVLEYDIDKEVEEEMHRILSKSKVTANHSSVAVMEEILPNEQKKKEMGDLNVLMIDEDEENVAFNGATQEAEDFEQKPPSPVEAKKVTEEGITEIFETEELRRSGIFDDTLQEEDETTRQTSEISEKDIVLANEENLEAVEKEKRGSLRWSLLEKWDEMNKRQSLEVKDESTNEATTGEKETNEKILQDITTDELQASNPLTVIEATKPDCTEIEEQDNSLCDEDHRDKEIPLDCPEESKESKLQTFAVAIPARAETVQEDEIAERQDILETEKNTDKEALDSVVITNDNVDRNQPQVSEHEFKETSDPVVLETVSTETTPLSVTTVKTTKTTTKTRVIKARSEVQPLTIQVGLTSNVSTL